MDTKAASPAPVTEERLAEIEALAELAAEVRRLRAALLALVDAEEAVRAAHNGLGHAPNPHDRMLHEPSGGDVQVFDLVGDCAACGGAQYGADHEKNYAVGDAREALGMDRRPWEVRP